MEAHGGGRGTFSRGGGRIASPRWLADVAPRVGEHQRGDRRPGDSRGRESQRGRPLGGSLGRPHPDRCDQALPPDRGIPRGPGRETPRERHVLPAQPLSHGPAEVPQSTEGASLECHSDSSGPPDRCRALSSSVRDRLHVIRAFSPRLSRGWGIGEGESLTSGGSVPSRVGFSPVGLARWTARGFDTSSMGHSCRMQ